MKMRRTQCLVLGVICATISLAKNNHLEFCIKEKAYCEAKCTISNGFLLETSKNAKNLENHHKNGVPYGYVCLPKKF